MQLAEALDIAEMRIKALIAERDALKRAWQFPVANAMLAMTRCVQSGEETAIPGIWKSVEDERDALKVELERERMRLAACGVVALSDTPESAAQTRQMHPDYESASCSDVARRVDECMNLRAELNALKAQLAALIDALEPAIHYIGVRIVLSEDDRVAICAAIDAARLDAK